MTANTRELIRQFNVGFDRPVNRQWTTPTVTERELFGKLLLEEVVEFCVKGLGLEVNVYAYPGEPEADMFEITHQEGVTVDPPETVDGLGDVNVVIHFIAHWLGVNLDKATEIINESNMSKLGEDGKPIINGVTPGYEEPHIGNAYEAGPNFDPDKPIGKILKGPNFVPPTFGLQALIMDGNND